MLRDERLQDILEVLRVRGFVTGKDLSRKFYISLPTVYRDLRELERQGLIIRNGGGVIPVKEGKAHPPLNLRQVVNVDAKDAIGRCAARLLRPGCTAFLDASSTVASMVGYLDPAWNVTVLTNGLMTAMQLQAAGIRTCCVGGALIDNSVAVCGRIAEETVDRFSVDIFFFSAYGVDHRGDIVDMSGAESAFRRRLFQKPATSVFLCDASKFGKRSIFRVVPLGAVDYVISDAAPPAGIPSPRREFLVV